MTQPISELIYQGSLQDFLHLQFQIVESFIQERNRMGITYSIGRYTHEGQLVVLKIIDLNGLNEMPRAVEQEINTVKALYELNHPSVVKYNEIVYITDKSGSRTTHIIISMESYAEDLSCVLDQIHGAIRTMNDAHDQLHPSSISSHILKDIAHDLYVQLLPALNALHTRNIVHRDVRPCNIFVEPTEEKWKFKFFLADVDLSCSVGTVEVPPIVDGGYWPPERRFAGRYCKKFKYLPSSDHFSLGVVILEILLLGNPFAKMKFNYQKVITTLQIIFETAGNVAICRQKGEIVVSAEPNRSDQFHEVRISREVLHLLHPQYQKRHPRVASEEPTFPTSPKDIDYNDIVSENFTINSADLYSGRPRHDVQCIQVVLIQRLFYLRLPNRPFAITVNLANGMTEKFQCFYQSPSNRLPVDNLIFSLQLRDMLRMSKEEWGRCLAHAPIRRYFHKLSPTSELSKEWKRIKRSKQESHTFYIKANSVEYLCQEILKYLKLSGQGPKRRHKNELALLIESLHDFEDMVDSIESCERRFLRSQSSDRI